MTTPFTSYAFKSGVAGTPPSDTRVDRTMSDRLNDILNVKDFGAKGDGVTDDTDAINAAIDYAYTLGQRSSARTALKGAVIFFPPGIYIIGRGNPGTVQLVLDRNPAIKGHQAALTFIGCGRDASILRGYYWTGNQMHTYNGNGFLVIANFWANNVMELRDLAIENLDTRSTSGAFMSQSGPIHAVNCRFKGVMGYYNQVVAFGGSVRDCVAECSRPITAASAASRSPYFTLSNFTTGICNGSVGFFLGQGFAHNCQATGFDIGFCSVGWSHQMIGCKASRCGAGILNGYIGGDTEGALGQGVGGAGDIGAAAESPARWQPTYALIISANWLDRCTMAIGTVAGSSFIAGNAVTGDAGPCDPAAITAGPTGITWIRGTATVTTQNPHNLPNGDSNLVLVTSPAVWTPGGTSNAIVLCTRTGANTFIYSLPSDPTGAPFSSGTWNYSLEYGIRTSATGGLVLMANAFNAKVSTASFDVPWGVAGGPETSGKNFIAAMRGASGWSFPSATDTHIGGYEFVQCGTVASHPRNITFAELPPMGPGAPIPSGFWLLPPVEGDEFNVTDCATQPNFAGTVTGGGSNHYKVRYDGTNWIRVG